MAGVLEFLRDGFALSLEIFAIESRRDGSLGILDHVFNIHPQIRLRPGGRARALGFLGSSKFET